MTRPKIWAHRGGRMWPSPAPPENSPAAFKKCMEAGVYGIEIDAHKCKSGELVVLHGGVHGGDVSHHTNGKGLVKDLIWDEIKALSLVDHGVAVAAEFAGERIALLSEVFELLAGKCVLNIEIKNAPWDYPGFADDLIDMIAKYGADNWVVLSSFDHGILKEIHGKAPHLKLGLLIDGLLVDIGDYAAKIGFQCWHPYLGELRVDYMEAAHKANLEVNVWTANTEDEWRSPFRSASTASAPTILSVAPRTWTACSPPPTVPRSLPLRWKPLSRTLAKPWVQRSRKRLNQQTKGRRKSHEEDPLLLVLMKVI